MSDFQFNDIVENQLLTCKDPMSMLKLLLDKFWNYTQEIFVQTRNYESALDFIRYASHMITTYKNSLSEKEFQDFDRNLISFHLCMLDCTNKWEEYIQLFEKMLYERRYVLTYSKTRDDPEFNKFVLYQDRNCKYVHFLYLSNYRYELIKRKYQKLLAGKNVEHLKKHPQSKLSNTEIQERYERVLHFIKLDIRNKNL